MKILVKKSKLGTLNNPYKMVEPVMNFWLRYGMKGKQQKEEAVEFELGGLTFEV